MNALTLVKTNLKKHPLCMHFKTALCFCKECTYGHGQGFWKGILNNSALNYQARICSPLLRNFEVFIFFKTISFLLDCLHFRFLSDLFGLLYRMISGVLSLLNPLHIRDFNKPHALYWAHKGRYGNAL